MGSYKKIVISNSHFPLLGSSGCVALGLFSMLLHAKLKESSCRKIDDVYCNCSTFILF